MAVALTLNYFTPTPTLALLYLAPGACFCGDSSNDCAVLVEAHPRHLRGHGGAPSNN